LNKTSFSN